MTRINVNCIEQVIILLNKLLNKLKSILNSPWEPWLVDLLVHG